MRFAFISLAITSTSLVSSSYALAGNAPEPAASAEPTAVAITNPSVDTPPGDRRDASKSRELNRVYLSFSPLHLIAPVVELTAEVRVHPRIGVAGIGAFGNMKAAGLSIPVWEVGGQFVAYPVGDFDHGMQLGAETLYVGASAESGSGTAKVSGTGTGLSTGAFVGYKLATKVGFTFNVQAGVAYMAVRASASNLDASATATREDSAWYPLVNANLGWSF